jgi:hypothetical protein
MASVTTGPCRLSVTIQNQECLADRGAFICYNAGTLERILLRPFRVKVASSTPRAGDLGEERPCALWWSGVPGEFRFPTKQLGHYSCFNPVAPGRLLALGSFSARQSWELSARKALGRTWWPSMGLRGTAACPRVCVGKQTEDPKHHGSYFRRRARDQPETMLGGVTVVQPDKFDAVCVRIPSPHGP